MSVSKWRYNPEICDGDYCPGDCDCCGKETEEPMMSKYINADELVSNLYDWRFGDNLSDFPCDELLEAIENCPSADVVEVKHGEWIKSDSIYACSVCHTLYLHQHPPKFCPECGADMRERKDNDK